MRRIRGWAAGAAVVACVVLAGSGAFAHRAAVTHVAYYTGATPVSLDCVACHFEARGGTIADRILRSRYRSPVALHVSADGGTLYVAAEGSGELLVVGTAERRLLAAIPAGRQPGGVALDPSGRRAFVTDRDADRVTVIDLERRVPSGYLATGAGPAGLAVAGGGTTLAVANTLGDDISFLDTASGAERARVTAGRYPFAAAASPDGARILVTNLLARPGRASEMPVSEVTVLDDGGRLRARLMLPNAHLLQDVDFVPGSDLAIATLVRPKNLIPALQVERGWMMTGGFALLDLARGEATQLPLDDVEEFYADPSGVAVTPDGRLAFVSHGGVDVVSAVDIGAARAVLTEAAAYGPGEAADRLSLSRRYVRARIPTAANPRGLAVSPDGRFVYVAERLNDSIGVIDVARLERVAGIDLEGPRHESLARRGEKVFTSARATLQHQFSCRSCHPDNNVDGLQYDFEPDGLGLNIVDNRTLLGIRDTGPFKWNGKNTSLYMQCGIRFARFLTRSEPFSFPDQVALAAFLQSLEPPRNRRRAPDGALTEAQRRGKEIFDRAVTASGSAIPPGNRCGTCHSLPEYTDRKLHDVGSASPGDSGHAFDTPQLRDLGLTAPYLHDGKALTLEEIWTVYSPDDTHGVTSDLGKQKLNDLIEYLRTL